MCTDSARIFARALATMGVVSALVLSGCQTAPVVREGPAAAPLQLIESQPLQLADDCQANGGYFVEFTVLPDGRTDRINALAAPECVRRALTTWVESFRYAAPGASTVSGVEWMLVAARRGS